MLVSHNNIILTIKIYLYSLLKFTYMYSLGKEGN